MFQLFNYQINFMLQLHSQHFSYHAPNSCFFSVELQRQNELYSCYLTKSSLGLGFAAIFLHIFAHLMISSGLRKTIKKRFIEAGRSFCPMHFFRFFIAPLWCAVEWRRPRFFGDLLLRRRKKFIVVFANFKQFSTLQLSMVFAALLAGKY